MENINSLQNQFLIAMPSLTDATFSQAVIYIYEYHVNKGAMGFVINKPLQDINLGEVLKHLQIPIGDITVNSYPVLRGGPIAQEQGFILCRPQLLHTNEQNSDKEILNDDDDIVISVSKQDLVELAQGKKLKDTVVSLGYAGWSVGQLEQELADNSWLVVPSNPAIIFDVPFAQRWRYAAATIGIDFNRLSSEMGHA